MKKLKIYKDYNDYAINSFLEKSKGKIKSYNPIVIEYDDKNINLEEFNLVREYLCNDYADLQYYKVVNEDLEPIGSKKRFNRILINFNKGQIELFNNSILQFSAKINPNTHNLLISMGEINSSPYRYKCFEIGYFFWQSTPNIELESIERFCGDFITKIT